MESGGDGTRNGPRGETTLHRRGFLRLMGAGVALVGTRGLPVMAGPFEENEYLVSGIRARNFLCVFVARNEQ